MILEALTAHAKERGYKVVSHSASNYLAIRVHVKNMIVRTLLIRINEYNYVEFNLQIVINTNIGRHTTMIKLREIDPAIPGTDLQRELKLMFSLASKLEVQNINDKTR